MCKFIVIFVAFISLISCGFHDANMHQNNQRKSCAHAEKAGSDSVDVHKLTENKWYFNVGPDCVNYITFKQDFRYEEDNCEWGLLLKGNYEISADSIILYEYDLASNSPSEDAIANTHIYTYVYQGTRLKLVHNKTIENGTVVSTYFPDSIFYYRFDSDF